MSKCVSARGVYVVQAVTFSDGRINRILKEQIAKSEYSAEIAAAEMKMDLSLLEAGASVYINDELRWSNYLAPGAPRTLQEAQRTA